MDEPMMEVECDGDEEEEMEEIEEEEEIDERRDHGPDLIPGLPAPPAFGDQQNGKSVVVLQGLVRGKHTRTLIRTNINKHTQINSQYESISERKKKKQIKSNKLIKTNKGTNGRINQ